MTPGTAVQAATAPSTRRQSTLEREDDDVAHRRKEVIQARSGKYDGVFSSTYLTELCEDWHK